MTGEFGEGRYNNEVSKGIVSIVHEANLVLPMTKRFKNISPHFIQQLKCAVGKETIKHMDGWMDGSCKSTSTSPQTPSQFVKRFLFPHHS